MTFSRVQRLMHQFQCESHQVSIIENIANEISMERLSSLESNASNILQIEAKMRKLRPNKGNYM